MKGLLAIGGLIGHAMQALFEYRRRYVEVLNLLCGRGEEAGEQDKAGAEGNLRSVLFSSCPALHF